MVLENYYMPTQVLSMTYVLMVVMCHVGRAMKPMLPLYFLALFGLHSLKMKEFLLHLHLTL
jgi:hypothetical protein